MKCYELIDYDYDPDFPFQSRGRFYDADEVDAAIAELKEKLAEEREFGVNRAKAADHDIGKICVDVKNLNDQLRATKRALWLARAEWARSSALSYHLIESHPNKDIALTYKRKANRWEKVKAKCLAKAKEYK